MQRQPQVIFRNMPPSEALSSVIRERMSKLEHFFPRIISCRVIIEIPHRHHQQGNLFHVSIDLRIPRANIAVNRAHSERQQCEDPYIAVHEAFDVAERKLRDRVNHHFSNKPTVRAMMPEGTVVKLFADEGFGFLLSEDKREIYFNRSSVLNDNFDKLRRGFKVRFNEEQGEQGPQASTVHYRSNREKHEHSK